MPSLGIHTSPYLNYAVGGIGVLSLGLGFTALVNPLLFLKAFNMKAVSPEARSVARDLLVVYAARDLALGFAITAAAYYAHKDIMGWSLVGCSVTAFLDGFVSRGNERGGEYKHWSSVGITLGLASACFGYI